MDNTLNSFLDGLEANSPNLYLVALAGCILVGIFLLTKGGDILTDGASDLARSLGVHPAIIGLTVVSVATSAPELFTSLAAIAGDAKDLIIGNVIGSNLANIGLVLGIATFINPIAMKGSLANWQTNLLLLTTLLFSISCLWIGKESFDRPLGIVFSIILVAYLIVVTRGAIIDRKAAKNSSETVPESKGSEDLVPPWKSLLIVLLASGALWLGSEVLVTGANGLLGNNLCRELLASGQEVRAFVRRSSNLGGLKGLPVQLHYGDVRDPQALKEAAAGCDVVYHTAAVFSYWGYSRDEMISTATEGATNTILAAKEAGVRRIVLTSSSSVLGPNWDPKPMTESDASDLEGTPDYFYSKWGFFTFSITGFTHTYFSKEYACQTIRYFYFYQS